MKSSGNSDKGLFDFFLYGLFNDFFNVWVGFGVVVVVELGIY